MRLPFLAKAGVVVVSLILIFRQLALLAQLIHGFPLNDFSVYMNGVEHTLKGNPYTQKFFDYYNYPPAATLFFYPFTLLKIDTAELIFTFLSLLSLLIATILLFKLTNRKPHFYLLLAISYLLLRFHPTRLTLTLGQINLVVLLLLLLTFYWYRQSRGVLAGVSLALAFIFKFTPAVLLLFFLLKKQFKLIAAFLCTVVLVHLLAIFAFGWPLTYFYYSQVLPQLLNQTGFDTLQLTYMNQSLSALLGRLGFFDNTHLFVKSAILLPLLYFFSHHILKSRTQSHLFTDYYLVIAVMTVFIPTFAWQHHYVFLIPAIFLLGIRHWALGIFTYLLLNFTITENFPFYANPFIHSHLFLSAAVTLVLILVSKPRFFPNRKLIQHKPAD